jgi:hypothetical protein
METKKKLKLNIHEIHIILHTNIPDGKPFYLTRDKLVPQEEGAVVKKSQETRENLEFNTYPFFTCDTPYPKSVLYNMNYEERANFFFNKYTFEKVIMANVKRKKLSEDLKNKVYLLEDFENKIDETDSPDDIKEELEETNLENKVIIDFNMNTMMELLYPTTYPTVNNINNTYNQNIEKVLVTNVSIKGLLPEPVQWVIPGIQYPYSYIRYERQIYTVTRSLWLNDMLNQPKYRAFILKFISYFKSLKLVINNLKRKDDKILKEIAKNNKNNYITKNMSVIVKDLQGYLKNNNKPILQKNVEDFINVITRVFGNLENIQAQTINDDNEKMKQTMQYISSYIPISNELRRGIVKFNKDVDKFVIINKITTKFSKMQTQIILKDDETEDENKVENVGEDNYGNVLNKFDDFQDSIETYFPEYNEMKQLIRNFTYPYMETTNLELQQIFSDYLNGENDNLYYLIMNNVKGKYLEEKEPDKILEEDENDKPMMEKNETNKIKSQNLFQTKYLYTGISVVMKEELQTNNVNNRNDVRCGIDIQNKNIAYYETYILVDVIGEKMNKENFRKVNCRYANNSLGSQFDRLLTKKYYWNVDKKRYFYDKNKGTKNTYKRHRK